MEVKKNGCFACPWDNMVQHGDVCFCKGVSENICEPMPTPLAESLMGKLDHIHYLARNKTWRPEWCPYTPYYPKARKLKDSITPTCCWLDSDGEQCKNRSSYAMPIFLSDRHYPEGPTFKHDGLPITWIMVYVCSEHKEALEGRG